MTRARPPLAAALLATLLAGCGGEARPPDPLRAEPTPEEQACRAEARRDPAVRAFYREANPMNAFNTTRLTPERQAAEAAAFRDCLRRLGAAQPGGVEAIRRR